MNALDLDTVLLSRDRDCLEILDQTLLPGTVRVLRLSKLEDIWEAIRNPSGPGRPGHRRLRRLRPRPGGIPQPGGEDAECFLRDLRTAKGFPGYLPSHGGEPLLGAGADGAHRPGKCPAPPSRS